MPWKELNVINQRTEFVLQALKTDNFRHLCREYGISPKTGYKWKERFLADGLNGMTDESRRPKSSPTGLEEGVVCDIVRLKEKHRSWGARKLRAIYARSHAEVPSETSFKRVLARAGLVEPRRLRKKSEAGRLFSGRRAQAPNEIWTVDFKGWWYSSQGKRCEPLTVRDEFSRYVLELRSVANARTDTVRACFERLFESYGLPAAIRSDNGSPFANTAGVLGLTELSAWWVALGIDLERGRPGCPQDNGAHERLHLDIRRELQATRGGEYQNELDEWRRTFNEERPHEALAMRFPAEVYRKSERRFEGTPDDLEYSTESRKVMQRGTITWKGNQIFVSTALKGWSIGLESCRTDSWKVWFGRLLLGQLESNTASFERAPSASNAGGQRP